MKIIRFRIPSSNNSYAYIRCWPWEKRAILRKMASKLTGLRLVTWEPGPKAWFASFMLSSAYRRMNKRGEK